MHKTSLENVREAVWTLRTGLNKGIMNSIAVLTIVEFPFWFNSILQRHCTIMLLGKYAKPCNVHFSKGKEDFSFPNS